MSLIHTQSLPPVLCQACLLCYQSMPSGRDQYKPATLVNEQDVAHPIFREFT